MLDPEQDVTIGMTMAGALTPAGLGGSILTLMEYGFVDFIISTGANLYHDMHHALAMSLHRGDFRLDDVKLQEEGVIRIYDILFDDKVLLDTDSFVRESLKSLPNRPISTSELHHHLGTQLLKAGVQPEYSILRPGCSLECPDLYIFAWRFFNRHERCTACPRRQSINAGPLGRRNETTAIVHSATRNGVIILGGGSPKNSIRKPSPNYGRC